MKRHAALIRDHFQEEEHDDDDDDLDEELDDEARYTLLGTNISPTKALFKMIFLFPRWDMLIPWRVIEIFNEMKPTTNHMCWGLTSPFFNM